MCCHIGDNLSGAFIGQDFKEKIVVLRQINSPFLTIAKNLFVQKKFEGDRLLNRLVTYAITLDRHGNVRFEAGFRKKSFYNILHSIPQAKSVVMIALVQGHHIKNLEDFTMIVNGLLMKRRESILVDFASGALASIPTKNLSSTEIQIQKVSVLQNGFKF